MMQQEIWQKALRGWQFACTVCGTLLRIGWTFAPAIEAMDLVPDFNRGEAIFE